MNSKERVGKALRFEKPDRVPLHDSFWSSTMQRWKTEGLPGHLTEPEVRDFFGLEIIPFCPDLGPQFGVEVIKRDKQYIIERNSFGEMVKNYADYSSTPEVIDSPVKSPGDWVQFKKRLTPSKSRRVSWNVRSKQSELTDWREELERFRRASEQGKFIVYSTIIGYDCMQRFVGSERLLMAVVTQPAWVQDMYMTQAELAIGMFSLMEEEGFKFDGVYLASDMAYRNGLLFSPEHYKKQLFPADRLICRYFAKKDIPVILHSDGYVRPLIPYLIEAGFSCLQPLEAKAGMDVRELKRQYGNKLAFMGNIDVRTIAHPDPRVVEEEIRSKFSVAKNGGGYIYHSDHSIPDNVSLKQYQRVLKLVCQYGAY